MVRGVSAPSEGPGEPVGSARRSGSPPATSESGLDGKADVVGLAMMGIMHSGGSKASSSLGARITISCDDDASGGEDGCSGSWEAR